MYKLTSQGKQEISKRMMDRNEKILIAAFDVFSRYGTSKTTMNDIAREAGIARQTLYNAYSGKNEVLRATVQFFGDKSMADIEEAWKNASLLSDKIDIFFQLGPISWYDAVQVAPDAADLVEGIHSVAEKELARMAERWVDRWTEVLLEHAPDLTNTTPDAAKLAEFLYSTSTNAKFNAPDRDVFLERLETLKLSLMTLIQPHQ